MSSELATLSAYFWFFILLMTIFVVLAPFLIWKNTANTTTLLRHLLKEQERTNDLLALILMEQGRPEAMDEALDKQPDDMHTEAKTGADNAPAFTLEED